MYRLCYFANLTWTIFIFPTILKRQHFLKIHIFWWSIHWRRFQMVISRVKITLPVCICLTTDFTKNKRTETSLWQTPNKRAYWRKKNTIKNYHPLPQQQKKAAEESSAQEPPEITREFSGQRGAAHNSSTEAGWGAAPRGFPLNFPARSRARAQSELSWLTEAAPLI